MLGWFGRGLGPPEAAARTLDEQRSARRTHFFLRPPSAASFWVLAIEVIYFQLVFQIWGVPTPPYPPLPPRGGPDLMGREQSYRVLRPILPYERKGKTHLVVKNRVEPMCSVLSESPYGEWNPHNVMCCNTFVFRRVWIACRQVRNVPSAASGT